MNPKTLMAFQRMRVSIRHQPMSPLSLPYSLLTLAQEGHGFETNTAFGHGTMLISRYTNTILPKPYVHQKCCLSCMSRAAISGLPLRMRLLPLVRHTQRLMLPKELHHE